MKRRPPETVPGIPEAQSLRLRMVGAAVYGEGDWISPLAVGIAMSRRDLHRLIDGKRSRDQKEIDVRLLHLIAHERRQRAPRPRAGTAAEEAARPHRTRRGGEDRVREGLTWRSADRIPRTGN